MQAPSRRHIETGRQRSLCAPGQWTSSHTRNADGLLAQRGKVRRHGPDGELFGGRRNGGLVSARPPKAGACSVGPGRKPGGKGTPDLARGGAFRTQISEGFASEVTSLRHVSRRCSPNARHRPLRGAGYFTIHDPDNASSESPCRAVVARDVAPASRTSGPDPPRRSACPPCDLPKPRRTAGIRCRCRTSFRS
jgi:hypothetical protein